jgi:Dyp-type peroxidase family
MLLVRIRDAGAAGRFIAALPITRNGKEPDDDSPCYNIGFTANGLIQLQIDPDNLADLPQEFREGMAARAGMLGDVRCNHPSNWPLPNRLDSAEGADTSQVRRVQVSSVDFVLQLRCARPDLSYLADWTPAHPLFDAVAALEDLPGRDGVHLLALEVMGHQRNSKGQIREHFGFVDGISQPEITAQPSPDTRQWSNTAALGDVLLGYANSYGDPPFPTSRRDSFLDKGTFLVVRKLQQNHRALDARLPRNTSARARVMAKMMGRTFGGIPLARSTGSNGFDFSDDPLGDRCPLHAHIRRANPREVRPVIGEDRGGTIHVPRIMRRGMSYGPRYTPSTVDCNRGLIFMAYNASIAEQYEVVQRWLSGGNSSGGYSGQSDPFLGVPERGKARTFRYLEDGDVKRQPLQIPEQEEPIVRVQWGLYLFVPSMRALKQISRPVGRPKLIDRGVALIEQLRRIEAEQDLGFAPAPHEVSAFDRWKALLEDVHAAQQEDLDALWAAVRAHHGGVLRTPYGVLVGSPELVREVFTDQGGRFSVRNYWWRLGQSFGDIYLSMDPEPRAFPGDDPTQPDGTCPYHEQVTPGDYATAAAPVNDIINAFSERWAFDPAYQAAQSYLASLTPGQQGNLRVRNLVEFVLGELAARWFGIPDGRHILRAGEPTLNKPDTLHCPFHFISSSRYAFSPHPGDAAIAEGQDHGDRLRIATEKWIREQLRKPPASPTPIGGPMIDLLGHDPARCASEIIGVMHGFLPSTLGNLLKAIMVWTDDGNLWRIQEDLLHAHAASAFDNARAAILDPLTRVMQYRPVPDQLHRLVVSEDVTLGKESLRSGEQIVLGLGSASAALLEAGKADATWVFGGPCSGRQATAHGCPGRKMAMGTMLGIVAALLDSGQLRAEPAPLILTLLGDPV